MILETNSLQKERNYNHSWFYELSMLKVSFIQAENKAIKKFAIQLFITDAWQSFFLGKRS